MASVANKILIYRLGSLGDTVIALPVFNHIRAKFPGADITLLTNKPVADKAAPLQSVLGDGYFFNRVLNYPVGTRNAAILFKLIKQLRLLKIDTVMYLVQVRASKSLFKTKMTAYRDQLFFRAAGVKNIIGLPALDEDYELGIDNATGIYEWEAKRLARRFEALGHIALSDDNYWDLHLTGQEQQAAAAAISTLAPDKPILAVSTGTKNQPNDWEEPNWIALFKQLNQTIRHWQLVFTGSADEAERADKCMAVWGGKALNLCGKTSPRVLAGVFKHARFFIGHDSGPMHIAAGVGTPCVAVFPAKNMPGQWYPRGSGNRVIYHKTDCAGCALDICIVQQKKCILSITVDEVYTAVMEMLSAQTLNQQKST